MDRKSELHSTFGPILLQINKINNLITIILLRFHKYHFKLLDEMSYVNHLVTIIKVTSKFMFNTPKPSAIFSKFLAFPSSWTSLRNRKRVFVLNNFANHCTRRRLLSHVHLDLFQRRFCRNLRCNNRNILCIF